MATDSFCRNNTMSFSNHREDQVQNLSNTKQTTLSAFQIYHLILKWQLKASLKRCFYSAWHCPQNSSPYNSFLGRQSAHMLHRSEWKLMSCYLIYRIHRLKKMELRKNSDMLPIAGLYFIVTEEVQMTSLETLNLFWYQILLFWELKIWWISWLD